MSTSATCRATCTPAALVGQSALHRDDMLDALRRTVDRRGVLPPDTELLIGEADALGYEALQDALGQLMHGTAQWLTLRVPKPVAAVGAWVQAKLEPLVTFAIEVADDAQAERVFAALGEGGKVTMPLMKTFWSS